MRFLLLAASSFLLSGCWFIFIPGSVVNEISDSITGDKGQNCVSAGSKIADRVRMPGGGWATVKSVSGTSVRCTDPKLPLRAELEFDPIK